MNRPFVTLFTAGVFGVSLTAGAFADPPRTRSPQSLVIATLEQRAQRLEQHAQMTKGAGRQELEIQRRQVQQLIERIKEGEAVDPHEIDTLLMTGPQ
jgi:hypothetical protein